VATEVITPQNFDPKSHPNSALPQAPLECPHKFFSRGRIFTGYRPLVNGEESVPISTPNPEIGGAE